MVDAAEGVDLSDDVDLAAQVGRVLAVGSVPVTELRAAVIIGSGSASFEMLRHLTEVLPVMICPRWVTRTRCQPIAITDVLHYLVAVLDLPDDEVRRRVLARRDGARAGSVTFTELAMYPCRVLGFGTVGPEEVPVVCLPGDPGSAMIGFEVLARPAIQLLGALGIPHEIEGAEAGVQLALAKALSEATPSRAIRSEAGVVAEGA